jgi:hypothetical protein
MNKQDLVIVRELAARVAEIAALPVQEQKRKLWRKLNGLKPERPMVMIDQVCWNEMNLGDELRLHCVDSDCRRYESVLRQMLYQWAHFPVDMVVDPFVRVPMAVTNTGFGVAIEEETASTDPTNSVCGHKYLEKIKQPRIGHDAAETSRRMAVAHELFDGLIDVRAWGADPYLSLWDPISMWMGVEGALYMLVDNPEFMHKLVGRMAEGYASMLDQLEEQGLLCHGQSTVHCTGAFTDELPAPGFNPAKPRAKDIWASGLAQMFSTVSPAMFKEFEVDYVSPLCARFGLVYYGCCDPLDGKMNEVRQIPHVRKISMSPWVDQQRGAMEIGGEYVFSRKPSPALLATERFDPAAVRADLEITRDLCEKNGCPLEFILKDISTVRYEPERLFQWATIAMEVAEGR